MTVVSLIKDSNGAPEPDEEIRKSGTEPLIRIMVEHSDSKLIEEIVQEISSEMKS